MKPIDVKIQPRMGVSKTFSLTLNGIRYRLFRSAVTVGVIAVAIAFMMNILAESLTKAAVATATRERTRLERRAAWWAARLSGAGSVAEILEELASAVRGDATYSEMRAMGGLDESRMAELHAETARASAYIAFFGGLEHAHRRILVHGAAGVEIFDRLQDRTRLAEFSKRLAELRSLRFVTPIGEFEGFLARWPRTRADLERIREGRLAAISKLKDALGGRPVIERLAEADGAFGEAVRAAGFALSAEEGAFVAAQAREALEIRAVEEIVSRPEARRLIGARLDMAPSDVNVQSLWRLLGNRADAEWLLRELDARGMGVALDADRVRRLARRKFEEAAMTRAERAAAGTGGGILGMGERMSWLVFASMIVCVVGVTNAMLMSVTERFREIATLKCLGALDDFIMLMFVFEAGLLGLVGGLIGAVAGTAIGVARMVVVFGWYLWTAVPFGALFLAMLISVFLGVVLAAVGAVYPSLKAARLAPMEAMRIQ